MDTEITNNGVCPPPPIKIPFWQRTWFQVSVFLIILLAAAGIITKNASAGREIGKHIAVIRVNGVMLTGSGKSSIFGVSETAFSEDVSENIYTAADDKSVKGIILRINSPGGTPVAAEEISEAIQYAKTNKKPVYACMDDTAASAAYWIASQCDKIYAHRTTVTGSIGVIMHGFDVSELMKKIGYHSQTVKAGKYKDIGTADRPMTLEEKAILQDMINSTYAVFISEVAKGRHLAEDQVKLLADGRVYSGTQAKNNKLVDEIGTYNSCLADIGTRTDLGRTPRTAAVEKKSSFAEGLLDFSNLNLNEFADSVLKLMLQHEIALR